MTTLGSSRSLFLTIGNGGGGSGGGGGETVEVIDRLTSTSTTSALSANMGKTLNDDLQLHKGTVATALEYGHVKIDNDTIKVNSEGQIYVDNGSGELRKQEFIFTPSEIGQTEFEFTMLGYTPEKYVDLLFYNTTKVHASDYTIEPVDATLFKFKIVLKNPVVSKSAIYNLVLIWNESKTTSTRLTKLEYVVNVSTDDSTVIEIPFSSYNPDTYIDLLFNNSIKVHYDQYEILPKDTSDLTKGYYVKLNKAPTNPTRAFFNLVFITNGLTSGGGYVDVSRFYDGSNAPLDKSLIWYKTS